MLFWEFTTHWDNVIETRRREIITIQKENKPCLTIDIAIPEGVRIVKKRKGEGGGNA